MSKKVIYPGTFDPITNGHIDLIERAAKIFPEMIIAVTTNPSKKPFFSLQKRIQLVELALANFPQVKVKAFDTLLIDFAKQEHASIILRGLRPVNDFEYEFQLAGMNRRLAKEIETLFLTPSEDVMFISSSLVREISSFGGDVSQFVPEVVVKAIKERG